MKKIITLILVISMTMSIWAYPIAAESMTVHGNEALGKETLNYVSIGDSMSNGIGMPGYDSTRKNGYLEAAPDAYPAQFTEWLKSFTGKDVNLTQLSTSAARSEDVYYMLTMGTEKEFTPDFWTLRDLLTNPDRWGKTGAPMGAENWDKHKEVNYAIANVFRKSVENADIISYAMGNANFGVFLMGRVMNIVGFGYESDLAIDRERYGYMTVENAIDLIADDEVLNAITMANNNMDVASFVESTYENWLEYARTNNLPVDLLDEIGNYFAYTTASFLVSYCKTIDLIIEINPDVELIIMPLVNTIQGLAVEIDGVQIDFGAVLGDFYSSINEYMVEYIKLKQSKGETNDATFIYADFKKVNDNSEFVESFAEAFETLYAPIVDGVYPESRLFCHSRFIGDIQDFVFPILFGGSSFDYWSMFDSNDVMQYEIALSQGAGHFASYVENNSQKVEFISYYLGIVDATLKAINNCAHIEDLPIEDNDNINLFTIISPEFNGISDKIASNIEQRVINDAYAFFEELCYIIDDENVAAQITALTVLPDAMSEEFLKNGVLSAAFSLYGRLKLAWGLSAHPSYNGHDMMTEAIINAYENREIICCHAYDDCMDEICNLCDAERIVVGHNFIDYVYNNDATCIQNGTETSKCDACEETHTREAIGTMTDHNFEDGRCSLCNEPDTNSSTDGNSNTNNDKNHKEGFFYRLINWIITFFTKLFSFGKK